eukprot:m51a1_g2031 hypothetical protein (1213) ;mRNA; r:1324671-1328412
MRSPRALRCALLVALLCALPHAARWPSPSLSDAARGPGGFALLGPRTAASAHSDAATSSPAGDVDGDRVPDVVFAGRRAVTVLPGPVARSASLMRARRHVIAEEWCSGRGAADAVGRAGDVDGDRIDDLVGAGERVGGVGDVNGDGLDDLGVSRADGAVVIVFGRQRAGWPDVTDLSRPSTFDGTVVRGATTFAGAGDVDRDGVGDALFGNAELSPRGITRAGTAFVVLGRRAFARELDLLGGAVDGVYAIEGARAEDGVGFSVAGAGDIDADNASDVVVAFRPAAYEPMRYLVVFGSASARSAWPRTLAANATHAALRTAALEVSPADLTAGFGTDPTASAAGDVNGDGYGDVALCLAVVDYFDLELRLFQCAVVLGAAAWPRAAAAGPGGVLANRTVVYVGSGARSAAYTRAVAPLGDIDGDGLDDLLFSFPEPDPDAGESVVVRGRNHSAGAGEVLRLSELEQRGLAYVIRSESVEARVGISVCGVGDINGDGHNDFAVGAPGLASVFLRLGPFGPNEASADPHVDARSAVLTSSDNSSLLGWSVSPAGDVNGDGLPDVVVGAPGSAGGAGKAFVVFGSKGLLAGVRISVDELDGSNGFATVGDGSVGRCGHTVSSAGDVNNDGLDDVLVTSARSPGGDYSPIESGRTYVVYGRKRWQSGAVAVSALDGSNGFALLDAACNATVSYVALGVGDVNGDKVPDVALGVNDKDSRGYLFHAYVLFGSSSLHSPTVSVRALNGTDGFALGSSSTSRVVLSSAGDVDGDKTGDLAVGRFLVLGRSGPWRARESAYQIRASILPSGHIKAAGHADINGDGLSDMIRLMTLSDPEGSAVVECLFGRTGRWPNIAVFDGWYLEGGSDGFRIADRENTTLSESVAVSDAGDLNGDSVDDVLVGSALADDGVGRVWVLYGSHEPYVSSSLSAAQGCCNATAGVEYSFTVPPSAFAQADGEKLALDAVWETGELKWLSFDKQTGTFSGVPTTDPFKTQFDISVSATNSRGISAAQYFTIVAYSSLRVDVGANALSLRFDGSSWSENKLAPIVLSTPAKNATIQISSSTNEIKAVFSLEKSSDVTTNTGGAKWTAKGTVAGINKLLARMVFVPGNSYSVTLAIQASDDLGSTFYTAFSATRRDSTEGDLAGFGPNITGVWAAIACIAAVALVVTMAFAFVLGIRRQRQENQNQNNHPAGDVAMDEHPDSDVPELLPPRTRD